MRVDLLVQRIALHREPIELTPAEVEANYADQDQANAACEIKADEPLRNPVRIIQIPFHYPRAGAPDRFSTLQIESRRPTRRDSE